MAEITPQPETDPDFEPLSRPRSCTWPLHRPEFLDPTTSSTSSPAPSQEPSNVEFIGNLSLLEGTEDYAEQKKLASCSDFQCQENCAPGKQHHQQQLQHPGPQQGSHLPHQQQQVPQLSSPASVNALSAAQRKSSSSRRNAWGNMSYADLITKAIDSSQEKRLTLSQIYDWMVKSVPYFKDKGDSNSSAGWKNSIRHNLSLHSRFMRVQNEGTGKSSWWMLNPDGGKSGKSPRRRAASMDNNSKFTKSRGRAAKKKVALQEGVEEGADSPGSQYSKWLGSPNSHSNDDFEAWSTFRTRTSSDASTLSGRHSPFLSEQDDLAEADVHMVYGGGAGTKMTATLPSLSEVGGTMAHHHGSENVMESLHNLNLLSPKNPQLGSDSSSHSSTSAMLQKSPYSSPSMAPQQQDYRKCLYSQAVMNSLSPVPMQTLPDPKPGFGPFLNHYNCSAGLLKELLTSEADHCGDMMPSVETVASQSGMGGHLLPSYNSAIQLGGRDGGKMMNPPQPHLPPHVHPQSIHSQGPSTSGTMNGCNMIPLTSLSRGRPPRFACLRTFTQSPHGHSAHGGVPASYGCTNGYRQPGLAHPHGHHQERLPSDLDDMPIESLECDMESVLHDTLMDGDTLDFNFDPAAGPYGFPQRVKTTTHSWVSG